jgi:CDP-6-deoxy-D-xylo-4-hexulose-3-dehydrase
MDSLVNIGLLIEDCCEALGATWMNQSVGKFGNYATYSFYFSHHISTLEGGMVVASHAGMADLLRIQRGHGWVRDLPNDSGYRAEYPNIDPKFLFVNSGYNLRSTELNAAIGLVQLPKLDGFVKARRRAAKMLTEIVGLYAEFLSIQHETPGGRSSWFGFPLVVNSGAPFTAAELRAYFESRGIETRAIICGNIARQPGMKLWPHRVVGDLRHADHVMKSGFSIGCHQAVDEEACEYVRQVLHEFIIGPKR